MHTPFAVETINKRQLGLHHVDFLAFTAQYTMLNHLAITFQVDSPIDYHFGSSMLSIFK